LSGIIRAGISNALVSEIVDTEDQKSHFSLPRHAHALTSIYQCYCLENDSDKAYAKPSLFSWLC
jgi:hypothetical protein